MKAQKPLIILAVTGSFLLVAYLVYDHLRPSCEGIFEQTAVSVRTKADTIRTKGEVFIGREKIQELDSSSQKVGEHLKTCCILADRGKLSPDQFQLCTLGAQSYEAHLGKVVASLNEAQTAERQNNPNLVKAKVEQINSELDAAKVNSKNLEKQVVVLPPPLTSATSERWELVSTPKLKSLGRISVGVPEKVNSYVEVFEAGGKQRLTDWRNGGSSDLIPGQYDVKILGTTVASVPVQPGMDTRIRTGVINIATDGYWEIYDETKTTRLTDGRGSWSGGLPVGKYQIKITGRFAEIVIKDQQVTNF